MMPERRGRKRADLQPRHKGLTTREAIWASIRRRKQFTLVDLRGDLHGAIPVDTIRGYVHGLLRSGHLSRVGIDPDDVHRRRKVYRLERDTGVEAPSVTRDGREYSPGPMRENIWRSAKVIKEFSVQDLCAVIGDGLDENYTRWYLRYLERAGYLVSSSKDDERYRVVPARFRGAHPPRVQEIRRVYDPNLDEVVWEGCAS